jgi:multidrug efflux system outer membrane protein
VYKKPLIELPKKWPEKIEKKQLTHASLSEMRWWKTLHNPELNFLIQKALKKNNHLKLAQSSLMESQATLKKIKLTWLPVISADGAAFRGEFLNPTSTPSGDYGKVIQFLTGSNTIALPKEIYNTYIAGLGASYTLNFFTKYNQTQMAKWDVESKIQFYRAVRLNVISLTVRSYIDILGFRKQLQQLNQTIHDMEVQKKFMLIQYKYGLISKINILNLDERIAYLKNRIPFVKQQIKYSENSLSVLVSQNPGELHIKKTFDHLNFIHTVPINLPIDLLKQRPDVLSAESELRKYNAQTAEAISALLPTVDISLFLNNFGFLLSNFFVFSSNILQGQVGMVIPLIDGSLYANIARAKAVEFGAIYHYVATLRLALADVDNAISGNENSKEAVKKAQEMSLKAQEQYKLGKYQYKEGAISYYDLLNFISNIDFTNLKVTQNKQIEMNSIVTLYQALAGGSQVKQQHNG